MKTYIDIETTGLSIKNDKVIIIGVLTNNKFKQFIKGIDLDFYVLDKYIKDNEVDEIVGYNSNKFDLLFIKYNNYISEESFSNIKQKDLMVICHNNNIKGGLKATEQHFGIERKELPLNFFQQKALWSRWEHANDHNSLNRYLRYNQEDIMNLPKVEQELDKIQARKVASYNAFKKAFDKKHKKK